MRRNLLLSVLIVISFNMTLHSQLPEIEKSITVTDNNGGTAQLRFGLDPTATDFIDTHLGEAVLPPLPPAGVFDARYNVAGNECSLRDYRSGNSLFSGQKIHELQFQPGVGTTITIIWNFDAGIIGRLQDVVLGTIIDVAMIGSGSYTVANPSAFNKLTMKITYGLPTPPQLHFPLENQTNVVTNPLMQWSRIAVATGYTLQIATDSACANTIIDQVTSDTVYQTAGLNHAVHYFWRVRSENAIGFSPWSAVRKFSTVAIASPQLLEPVNNAVNVQVHPVLQWLPVSSAQFYYIQLALDSAFANIVYADSSVTAAQVTVQDLQHYQWYYWRVRAKNSFSTSVWSTVWQFRTVVQPPVYDLPLLITDNSNGAQLLRFGLAPDATDGIDIQYNENPLPPLPPAGIFDARCNLPVNESSLKDYRNGSTLFIGKKLHELQFQPGNGSMVAVSWNLPDSVQGRLQDIILGTLIDTVMQSEGSLLITNPAVFNKLKMTIGYGIPAVPALLSPAGNAAGLVQPVTLVWAKAKRGESYILQVASDSLFAQISVVYTGITDTVRMLPVLAHGTRYFWRVRSSNPAGESGWSDALSFVTQGLPATVQLAQPLHQSVGLPVNELVFRWRRPEMNTGAILTYHMQVSPDSLFGGSMSLNDSTLTDTTLLLSGLQYLTTYYWRVKAANEAGWGMWSLAWKFTTVIERPDAPLLVSPVHNSSGLVQPVTAVWRRPLRGEKYILQVSLEETCTTIVYSDSLLTDTVKTLPHLNDYTVYYWRVRSSNSGGESDWSLMNAFKTLGTPYPVALSEPAHNSVRQPVSNLICRWQKARERIETLQKYQYQLAGDSACLQLYENDSTLTDTMKVLGTLLHDTVYYWRVRASNEAGWGEWSEVWKFRTMFRMIAAPGNLHAENSAFRKVQLTWTDHSDNELGFAVLRKTGDSTSTDSLSLIKTLPADVTIYIDTSAAPSTLYSYLVVAYNADTISAVSNYAVITTLTGMRESTAEVPGKYYLNQNYPNPFNPGTVIQFGMPEDNVANVRIYSIAGRLIKTIISGQLRAGNYAVYWNGCDDSGIPVPAGVYILRMHASKFVSVRKMILIR